MTTVRAIRILSAAKVSALLYGIIGLLLAPFLLLGPGLAMIGGSSRPAGFGGVIVFAVFLPFCYAAFGFLSGALMAFLYNAIARAIGGIEVELEVPPPAIFNTPAPVPPPPMIHEPQGPSTETPSPDPIT